MASDHSDSEIGNPLQCVQIQSSLSLSSEWSMEIANLTKEVYVYKSSPLYLFLPSGLWKLQILPRKCMCTNPVLSISFFRVVYGNCKSYQGSVCVQIQSSLSLFFEWSMEIANLTKEVCVYKSSPLYLFFLSGLWKLQILPRKCVCTNPILYFFFQSGLWKLQILPRNSSMMELLL